MPTLGNIYNQINSFCEVHHITLEEYPLINEVKQYLQTQMGTQYNIWGHVHFLEENNTPNNTQLSHLVQLFKPELKKWNLQEMPSIELNLLPILVNAILPTCDNLPSFKNMELDLEDIHFMEVLNSFSQAWRIPFKRDGENNAKIFESMTSYFLKKYAPTRVDECEKIVENYLSQYRDDPFQMTACLIILAKKNLLQRENLRIILSIANNPKFTNHIYFYCNLSNIAASLVTLSRYSILSDETRGMIHEYMNFGATYQDLRDIPLYDPDPTSLVFFFKLLSNLDMWSSTNARLIFNNKKGIMDIVGLQTYKPFAKLLNMLRDGGLLTQLVLQQIIGNAEVFRNIAFSAEGCIDIIPHHLWTAELLQQVITASATAVLLREQIYQLIGQEMPNFQGLIQPARAGGNSQSTHSMSVHTTVASSLNRLNHRYPLTESDIKSKLKELEAFADELTSGAYGHLDDKDLGEMKTSFAAQSIQRMLNLAKQNTAKESQTKFYLNKILALIWTGIQDENLHNTSLGLVPKDKLTNELYNIEVAYGIQEDGRGAHSCNGGSINGLLLALDGVHTDVHIDLIDESLATTQTLNEAKKVFLEQFKLVLDQGKQSTFIQKYEVEIKNTDWQDIELQHWYTHCLEKIRESSIKHMCHRIDTAQIDNPDKISELKKRAIASIDIALKTLSEDKYMLQPTKRAYELEKSSAPAMPMAVHIQEEVGKLSPDEKEAQKYEGSTLNNTDERTRVRSARLKYFNALFGTKSPSSLSSSNMTGVDSTNTKNYCSI